MADRREQLLAAFDEAEDDETDTAEGDAGEPLAGDADAGGDLLGDKSVVADDAEPSAEGASDDGEKDAGSDGKPVAKAGKKLAPRSDARKVGAAKRAAKVSAKAVTPTGPQDDAAAAKAATEKAEKDAAAAIGDAPPAWKPAVREHWNKIPTAVREEVKRRETEITQFIGKHGAAIQHKAQFDEIVQPFMPFIAAQSSTPMKAFHGLMTTAARLTTSPPQGKAQVIAEIMRNYGVDVKTLDAVLSAQMSGGAGPNVVSVDNNPPAWARPMMQFMTEAQQSKVARDQRVQQEAAAELTEAEKLPFFNDMRTDIGLLMERAAAKGELLTPVQAHAKARRMNPEIDQILTQREQAAAAAKQKGAAAVRKTPALIRNSIGGGMTGAAAANGAARAADKAPDRRSILTAAFDAASED